MSTEPLNTNQCSHINAAGRRCRLTVAPAHDTLCAHHLQQHIASQPDPEVLAAELLESTGNLNTADRVNALLANTVKQLASALTARTLSPSATSHSSSSIPFPAFRRSTKPSAPPKPGKPSGNPSPNRAARLRPSQPATEPIPVLPSAPSPDLQEHELPEPEPPEATLPELPEEVLLETVSEA